MKLNKSEIGELAELDQLCFIRNSDSGFAEFFMVITQMAVRLMSWNVNYDFSNPDDFQSILNSSS